MASRKFHTGWILCKERFNDSYESKRLIEEFELSSIDISTAFLQGMNLNDMETVTG